MYPAASLCYAYEPGGEGVITGLADKFKKRNWFLPASGDMVRISYYMSQYFKKDSEYAGADAFANAIDNNILKKDGLLTSANAGQQFLTSTEFGIKGDECLIVISSGLSKKSSGVFVGICNPEAKYNQYKIRAVCRF
jgi:hypothetical protein